MGQILETYRQRNRYAYARWALFSRLLRTRPAAVRATSRRRLELVFYRGEAKTHALRSVYGLEGVDAIWVGLYFNGQPKENLMMIRETLEMLTPAYAGISFTLSTNNSEENLRAKATLEGAGIRYDESVKEDTGAVTQPKRQFWLSGSTLNRDLYRLVFESMYDFPTLLSHRFVFTISPPSQAPDMDPKEQQDFTEVAKASCIASTYFWKGLQLVSAELTEEAIERLALNIASSRGASVEVRNR